MELSQHIYNTYIIQNLVKYFRERLEPNENL